jgi:competence protein ComEC
VLRPGPHPRAPAALRLAPHLLLALLCAGLAAALAVPAPVTAAAACAVGAALGALVAIARGRGAAGLALLAAAAALGGWAWGGARLAATTPPALDLPAEARGSLVLDAPPVPDGRGGLRALGRAERLHAAPGGEVPAGTRLLVDLETAGPGPPGGARLVVSGRLRPAAGPDAPSWWRRWLARQGIAARIRPRSVREAGRRGGLQGLRDRWRTWAGERAGAGLEGDRAALVRGMALGGGSGLSEGSADAFRDAGLWHLLAVSGQNVTVVAVAVLAALTSLGAPRRAGVAGAALIMAAYCLACDGGASVARAGIVGGLGLLAELRSAPRERWYLLLVGLAALLAHQPRALGDPGLQLSFAAVAGLFVLAPPIAAWLRGWMPARLADLAGMAAAAGLATAPVLVWQFGRLSLAGLALNVVAVPLAAPVVVLALAGLLAGALLPAAGVALAWVAGLGAEALLLSARAASALPGAAVDIPGWAAPLAALPAIATALAGLLLRPGGGERARALPWRPIAALATAGIALAWAMSRPGPPPPWPAVPAITVLDVGQGDAILLRSPEGATALVDAGPPGTPAPVVGGLRRMGVGRVDVLVLTHDSLDHVGGTIDLLERVRVGTLVHEPVPVDGFHPAGRTAIAAARERGIPVREARAGATMALGEWRLRVLSPARRRPAGGDPNIDSLVALASAGGLDALLTADAESPALSQLALPRVEVLKVPHQGSEDPGLEPVLARLGARVALISVGEGNPYRHPRERTLDALRGVGAGVWRTDLDGDLTVTGAEGTVAVETAR